MAGSLVTVGGLSLAAVSVQGSIVDLLGAPAWVFQGLLLLGLLAAGAAGLVLAWPLLIHPVRADYRLERATEADLPQVHQMGKDMIGDSVISLKSLRETYDANDRSLWVLRRQGRSVLFRGNRIVGFFSVLPVTAEAAEKLKRNREGGFRVTASSIVPDGTRPGAWYVSAIGGAGTIARGRTRQQLEGYVNAKAAEAPLVLAWPATNDGLDVCRAYGLKPTDPDTPPLDTVHYRDLGNPLPNPEALR